MNLSEAVSEHVRSRIIQPARRRGVPEVSIAAGEVHRELRWTSRVPVVCAALNSAKFQRAAGVELIGKSGPPSGQSSTVVFRYRVLPNGGAETPISDSTKPRSTALAAAFGICKGMYDEDGGAEAFIRAQRENFGAFEVGGSEETQESRG